MRLVSVNVGMPRLISWQGATFKTSIFKKRVDGRIMLRQLNLDGDRQSDLSVHGGVNKAVYAYPSEHYSFWRNELPQEKLPWGAFGENFSTEGLLESQVCMGDQYRVGAAGVMVTTPRLPCFKLAAKFQSDDIIKRFLDSGYSGFYFSVVEEGEVSAGDEFQFLKGEIPSLTIAEFNQLYTSPVPEIELFKRAVEVKSLPESWRTRFHARLEAALRKPPI